MTDTSSFKEIECNEPLIFNILERSKDFYAKDWNVNLELNLDKGFIKLSSVSNGHLERLYSSINIMIRKLIKINIQYKENEFAYLTSNVTKFKEKYKKRSKLRIVYRHSAHEKLYTIGLTAFSDSENNELELLQKEIIDWNFDIVGPAVEFLIIFNYKSNLDSLVKMHLSKVLDLDDSQKNLFIIEDALILEYSPEKGEFLKMNE